MSGAEARAVRRPPRFKLLFTDGEEWSQMISTDQAGVFFGKSGRAMRAMILERAKGASDVVFDGVWARKLGNQWRVRVHRCWMAASCMPAVPG